MKKGFSGAFFVFIFVAVVCAVFLLSEFSRDSANVLTKQSVQANVVPRLPVSSPSIEVPDFVSAGCVSECAKRKMSANYPSSLGILSELQNHRCVAGSRVAITRSRIGRCDCFSSDVQIISEPVPFCRATPCGDIACDRSVSCDCPDKPDCKLTVSCNWGGWKESGSYQYVPVLGGNA